MSQVISLDEWRKKQELLSKSVSTSTQNIPWEELGLTPTETDFDTAFEDNIEELLAMIIVLDRAWSTPFTVKSNFARDCAMHVALCASEGFISTAIDQDIWGNRWQITEEGRDFKEYCDERIRMFMSE